MNDLIARTITARRARCPDGDDLLALLLRTRDAEDGSRLDDRQIRDELAVMLGLGSHQCTVAMSWVLHLLAEHPDEARRAREELATVVGERAASVTDLPRLSYLGAIVDEALRLYPPFFFFAREARVETSVAGVRLRAGDAVGLSPWVTQRDGRYFVQPDQFMPSRWLDPETRARARSAYFPFGGGPRVCVANHYVAMQLRLVLAAILQRATLESVAGAPVVPQAAVALGMRNGLTMRVRTEVLR